MNEQIKKAVDIMGSQAALARAIKKTSVFVNDMLHQRKPVPAALCPAIEAATKRKVKRADLRPDVFGPAKRAG